MPRTNNFAPLPTCLEVILALAASNPRDSVIQVPLQDRPLSLSLRRRLGVFLQAGSLPSTIDGRALRGFPSAIQHDLELTSYFKALWSSLSTQISAGRLRLQCRAA